MHTDLSVINIYIHNTLTDGLSSIQNKTRFNFLQASFFYGNGKYNLFLTSSSSHFVCLFNQLLTSAFVLSRPEETAKPEAMACAA